MVNRPKNIGTAGETGVLRYLRSAFNFPENRSRRVTLAGNYDLGDLHIEFPSGVMGAIEVKAGKQADEASVEQVRLWQAEAELEAKNAKMSPMLVVKRRGVSPDRAGLWRCFIPLVNPQVDGITWFEAPLADVMTYLTGMHGDYRDSSAVA